MKSVRSFSLFIVVATVGLFLTACSPSDPNAPAPAPSNVSSASSPPKAPVSPYPGAVDKRDCDVVAGWTMNGSKPEATLKVDLLIDNTLVETIPAQDLRPDLAANKVGTGRYGFSFKIPATYKDGKGHSIRVKVNGTDFEVPFFQGTFPSFECKPA